MDTNVFVAALQSKLGASHLLMQLIGQKRFDLCISVPLILEYEEVGARHLDRLGINANDLSTIIDYICKIGVPTQIYYLWRPFLKDTDDDMILELAVSGNCNIIVTFNQKDFSGVQQVFGIEVLTPKQFLKKIGEIK